MKIKKPINSSVIKSYLAIVLMSISSTVVVAKEMPAMPVVVTQPESKNLIEYDEFTGRFQAFQDVEIKSRVSGYLEEIHFKDGQEVKAGDLLFSIDPRPYQAIVDEARADLARNESEQELARQEVERAKRLVKINAMSQEELDTRNAALKMANANIQAAKATLRTASLDLEYTKITAPIDGHISNRRIDIGNLIQTGGEQVLTQIVSYSPLYFVFDVSESDYLKYQRRVIEKRLGKFDEMGLQVNVRLLDETNFVHEGTLDFIDNKLDNATSTIRLRALLTDNGDGLLLPGIFGRVKVPATDEKQTMLIPDQAVLSDMANKMVLTVNKENIIVPKPVQLGNLYEGKRIIKSGLDVTDKVVVEGIFRARPGAKVIPKQQGIEVAGDTK